MDRIFLKKKNVNGFTLTELLIALAIMLSMTAMLLGKYPESSMKITLANANSSLSLFVREAQMRGSSVDSASDTLGGYGIFFDRATTTDVILFGDRIDDTIPTTRDMPVGNGLYDKIPVDEKKDSKPLPSGYSYKKLCVASTTASLIDAPYGFVCNATSTPIIETLTISFTRPSQVAHIYVNSDRSVEYISACIELYSPKSPAIGHVRSLRVYHSGMAITSRTSCD